MSDVSGTLRGVSIEGIPYRVAADVNVTFTVSTFEKSKVPSSGRAMTKMVKRVPAMEGIQLLVNGSELNAIKVAAEALEDVKFSVEMASGDVYKSEGAVELENYESEEARANIQFLPSEDWTPFLA